ncbi:hypothetical protein [Aliamphritea hakodatensis]|uniref:hypothetical protein n=1 Tax=Aliamphritea hakodatensis TaxID=2895352 RepID=UPI0022FD590B|nr:hypothetical protein [Aliamphritea hakodatensis]
MRIAIGLGLAVVVVSGLLYWQIKRNGELSAVIDQHQATITQQNAIIQKERTATAKTNAQLAESRQAVQRLQRNEQVFNHDLEASADPCINSAIPADVAQRVQQFRDSNNGNNP